MPSGVSFDTTVAAAGNNTGIVVPDNVIERLGAGRRPAVVVTVNGHQYRSTVAVMGGKHMISISAAVRNQTGLEGGDPVHVTLTLADTPRNVDVPGDFAAALSADADAGAFFAKLANSLQRYHVDNINGAKSAETRQQASGGSATWTIIAARTSGSAVSDGNRRSRRSRSTSKDESRPHDRHDHLHRRSDAPQRRIEKAISLFREGKKR